MSQLLSNNGDRRQELNPQAPKAETDEKIGRNFNGVIFGALALLALGVLIAIWFIHHRGRKISPSVTQTHSAQAVRGPRPFDTPGADAAPKG